MSALFFGAHPDDVELTSAGLAARLAGQGVRVVIADLTRGERASRGTPEARAAEAAEAARRLGAAERVCLALPDGGLDAADAVQRAAVVACLRRFRPRLVVAPDADDAHPDHVQASALIAAACYLSGLARFEAPGERWRPSQILFAMYRGTAEPRVVVDVTSVWDRRMAALEAHRSQLDPEAGPPTYLTAPGFRAEIESRARVFGALAGGTFGEAYRSRGPVVIHDPRALMGEEAVRGI